MPTPGATKRAYCAICKQETTWEYTLVQFEDGLLGIQNLMHPELHQVHFWRCCNHTTANGLTKPELRKGRKLVYHDE